jgi:acetyl-CoA carboxylase carboxyl transferase subunit alpha
MLENAWYSVIAPESCTSLLWRSWDDNEEAARALKHTAPDLIEVGVIDSILTEPTGGAHRDPQATFRTVGAAIAASIADLDAMTPTDRIDARIDKFDQMGVYEGPAYDAVAEPVAQNR